MYGGLSGGPVDSGGIGGTSWPLYLSGGGSSLAGFTITTIVFDRTLGEQGVEDLVFGKIKLAITPFLYIYWQTRSPTI